VEIAGFVARVRVTQVFSNPFPDPIEAVYTFPLSHRGAVDAMWMRSQGREIRGEIHRREQARLLYERARERGQVAALLDQERPNVFTQSVANLMPGASVEIEIHYVETLEYEDGTFSFSFPTVVGPRFVPGAPVGASGTGWAPDTTRVPDASRVTPPVVPEGTRAGHDIAITLDIEAGVSIERIDSPLHEIAVDRPGDERALVRLARRDEIPNRDFVLRYTVAADDVRSGVLAHRSEGPGTVTFLLLPPKRVTPQTAAPKEMIFVVDRSGSQRGLPLLKAKETLLWILDHMNPNDTFQIVDFGSTANVLFERPQPASPAMKAAARRYIEGLEANGGTMMAEAVQRVASLPAEGHRLRTVVFMTDGYIGNDFEVIDLVRRLRGTSRWFAFGTGNSVNRFLLEGIAREGGGEVEIVLLDSPGHEVAQRFWQRIGSPVLTDVTLEFRGLDVTDVFPQQVSDLWAGKPLVIQARYDRPGTGQVILRGYRGGEAYREVLDVRLPRKGGSDALASMWARAKVDALMRRDLPGLQSGSFAPDIEEEIVEVALAHGLLTQFTSFVAVEERVVNEGGRQWTETVPVDMPEGVTYEGVFGTPGESGRAVSRGQVRRYIDVGRLSKQRRAPASGPSLTRLRALGYVAEASPTPPTAGGDPTQARPEPAGQSSGGRGSGIEEIAGKGGAAHHDDARGPKKPPLSAEVRQRLAPPFLALIEGRATSDSSLELRDGRVRIKLLLRDPPPDLMQRLEEVGLDASQVSRREAVGWIAVEDLVPLAELDCVERIELP
jgi:Ca-activated chloride channel family protein